MLKVGDKGSFQKTITETDVVLFAGITGDFNPVHISEKAAKESMFGDRIAHGMLSASLISTVIGMYVPGPGTIYLEQNCKFIKAVKIGDTLTAESWVEEIINADKGIIKLVNQVSNQHCECVVKGTSIVMVDKNLLKEE